MEFAASSGVKVDGDLDLSDLRVDGRPVDWGSSAEDWNTTEDERAVIRPSSTASGGALRLHAGHPGRLSRRGSHRHGCPARSPPCCPPRAEDPLGLVVTGVDGSDRSARSAGRVTLIPAMPRLSALVDLDAISRGPQITFDTHAEVWLVDDPELVAAVTTSLRERGIAVTDVRRLSTIRQANQDTVATWSLALGAVVGPAVILLALLVLLVLAVTGWRDRARDLAILRLNGAGWRTTRRLAVWAQLPAILLAIAAGVAAGLVGAALAMPDVSFFPDPAGRHPSSTRRPRGPRSSTSPPHAWRCCWPRPHWPAARWPAGLTSNA